MCQPTCWQLEDEDKGALQKKQIEFNTITLEEIKDTARDQNSASGDWRGGSLKSKGQYLDAPRRRLRRKRLRKTRRGWTGC